MGHLLEIQQNVFRFFAPPAKVPAREVIRQAEYFKWRFWADRGQLRLAMMLLGWSRPTEVGNDAFMLITAPDVGKWRRRAD